jgi:CheY-like chemotaxis protein
VELASRTSPEVVLCDIGLPDIDGHTAAREIRARARGAYLVALSGYAQSDDVMQARQAGFDAHLAKPASVEQLETCWLRFRTRLSECRTQPSVLRGPATTSETTVLSIVAAARTSAAFPSGWLVEGPIVSRIARASGSFLNTCQQPADRNSD